MKNSSAELSEVIRLFLAPYLAKHKISAHKYNTLMALTKCRTEYMGGHIEKCNACGKIHTAYNSCRNRHCPKCGALDKEKWILRQEENLLPVKYFHVVFTLPHSLHKLFLNQQEKLYNLFFSMAWEVLKDFGKTKKWIGGKIGATCILHTTGQNLSYHPHLHFIVPGGALMPSGKWKNARNRGKYLFPTTQLSSVFRARFVEELRILKKKKEIKGDIPKNLFDKDWVVYAKRPFGGPRQVLNYLGRYTHRTAISNDRILQVDEKEVVFSWRNYKKNGKKEITRMKGEDFLGRFLQHILPKKFTRIRHYGFLSSASKKKSLRLIRKSLRITNPIKLDEAQLKQKALERMGINPGICQKCGGKMEIIEIIEPQFRRRKKMPRPPPYKELYQIVINSNICNTAI